MFDNEELKEYKGGKKEAKPLYARMPNELANQVNDLAKEYGVYPAVIVRYIVDKACDRMENDEKFRNYILNKTLRVRESCDGYIVRKYLLRKDINDKLEQTNQKYRINNVSSFLCEILNIFLEDK